MHRNHEKKGTGLITGLPKRGQPVDLEFELSLYLLAKCLRALQRDISASRSQVEFFKSLRSSRSIFKHRIVRRYGDETGASCGKVLLEFAQAGAGAFQNSKNVPPRLRQLLKSYIHEIKNFLITVEPVRV